MSRAAWGFVVIAVAIIMMLSGTLFDVESDLPFLIGLWVGVVGLALINSGQREETRKQREIYEEQVRRRTERDDKGERGDSEEQ